MTEGIVTTIASSPSSTARGSSGRTIGYGEFGDPNGKPMILFHGFGDSRLTRYPDDELTARLGIRLITFDRPGIGLTDPMKELTILDRTDDVIDLTNQLGLNDVYLLGWSGGAPFALAAAGCMAGKVKRTAIVSGFGPLERPGFKRLAPREIKRVMTILKVAPWMANVMATESQKSLESNASGAMEASRGLGGSADSGVLNMSGVRSNVTAGAEEAFRQGPAGVANDMLLLFRFKWGFNPEDVHAPIDLWYGDADQMTPPDVGRGLASVLPQPRLRMVPGAGHLLYLRNWEEILRTLVADEAHVTTATFQPIAPAVPLSPVTETLAAASLSDTTTVAEPEHAEEGEPVTAHGDVLGSTPAWSWTQPAAASQAQAEAPTEKPAEREPVAFQAETAAPAEKPVFTPRPRVTPAGSDQLARLRALGFIVEVPEPQAAEPEAPEPKAEAATVGEPEAVAAEAEVPAGLAEPETEAVATEPEAEAVVAEPEAEAVVAEPEAEAEVVAEPEAEAFTADTEAAVGELGETTLAPELEATSAEAEPTAEPAPTSTGPRPSVDSAELRRLRSAGFFVGDPEEVSEEPAADVQETATSSPEPATIPSAAATEAEAAASPPVEPVELPGERRVSLADAALARLRAAGFALPEEPRHVTPAEVRQDAETAAAETPAFEPEAVEVHTIEPEAVQAEPVEAAAVEAEEVEAAAVEAEGVEAPAVEAEGVKAEAVEAESVAVGNESVATQSEAVAADVEAAPISEEPLTEAEPASESVSEAIKGEAEGESVVAGAEPEPVAEAELEPEPVAAAEPEPAPVAAEAETEPVATEAKPKTGRRRRRVRTEPVVAEPGGEPRAAEAQPAPVVAADAERVAAEAEPAAAEAQAQAQAEAEPAPEPLAAEQENQPEPAAAEAEPEPEPIASEPELEPVATELEEQASEAVVLPGRDSEADGRLAVAGLDAPHSEPAPAIASSAADAPIMKAAARTPAAGPVGEQIAETGVGWVESVPMDATTVAAAAQQPEPDSPPEPMPADDEPSAPVRDETMERLRAAGFLIGEPRRR